MKRWSLLSITAVILVVASVAAARSHVKTVAQKRREIAYQSALQKYSQDLKPGLRRTEVESYLRARKAHFSWMYTAFGAGHESQYADLIKIGEEAAPWYCSEAYVYVAFEFSGVDKFEQNDSDRLERIEIFRPYSGCL